MANHQQSWAPQSPDLSAYAPQSPVASWAPQSPKITGLHTSYNSPPWEQKGQSFGGDQYQQPVFFQPEIPTTTRPIKNEDPDWLPQETDNKHSQFPPDTKPLPQQKMDTHGIEVKTKFPTARIKRIMQADEDVGKVAQVTPVVMAKALELFMIRLITASADIAKSRGSKRVQTTHMKQAVMADDQFDNLREIVAKVPDAPAKKGAKDSDSDDEDGPKKRKKSSSGSKGKKRRGSDDDI